MSNAIKIVVFLCMVTEYSAMSQDIVNSSKQQSRYASENKEILQSFKNGKDLKIKLSSVITTSSDRSPTVLTSAAAIASKLNQIEDYLFLYFAARISLNYDLNHYPPSSDVKSGIMSMLALQSQQEIGEVLRVISSDTIAFDKACERLKTWRPSRPNDYRPEYPFVGAGLTQDIKSDTDSDKLVMRLVSLSKALKNEQYLEAFKTVANYASDFSDSAPKRADAEKASRKLHMIEKDMQLETLMSPR